MELRGQRTSCMLWGVRQRLTYQLTLIYFALPDDISKYLNPIVPAQPAREEAACALLGQGLGSERVQLAGRTLPGCKGTELSAVAVTRPRNVFSLEELVDFKNKAATAYAPWNVWDQENGNTIFHSWCNLHFKT